MRSPLARTWSHVATIALANASVAGFGFLGNWLLTWQLDVSAFAAISLFLASFQFLQEAFGRSLHWAMLRLAPRTERERSGGAPAMIRATWNLQCAFACGGPIVVAAAAWFLHSRVDAGSGPPTTGLVALATVPAAAMALMQFNLGRLQLRERFVAMSSWMISQSLLRLLVWVTLWGAGALDLPTAIGGHVASTFVLAVLLHRFVGPVPAPQNHGPDDRGRVLRFGGHLVLASTLAALAAQIDLFVLDARAGDASTARYRVAILIVTVVELASSAVMTSLLPGAARAHDASTRRAAMRRSLRWGALIAVLGLLSYPVVELALPLLFPSHYADVTSLYPILLGGVLVTALTDPLGLTFLNVDKPHRFVVLNTATLLTVLLGNLFVPGDDRTLVAAWVRTGSRVLLGAGIVFLLVRDSQRSPLPDEPSGSKADPVPQ